MSEPIYLYGGYGWWVVCQLTIIFACWFISVKISFQTEIKLSIVSLKNVRFEGCVRIFQQITLSLPTCIRLSRAVKQGLYTNLYPLLENNSWIRIWSFDLTLLSFLQNQQQQNCLCFHHNDSVECFD